MLKRVVLIAVLVLAAVLAAAAFLRVPSLLRDDRPPLAEAPAPSDPAAGRSGGLADFTAIDPPRLAPDTPFLDAAGRERTLADFRGRVVLLNLWATWCGPCVEEMPALDRLQARLGGEDFTVLALSQDRDGAARVEPFYREHGLAALEIYLDPQNRLMRALGAHGLPTTLLIDREGRIRRLLLGPAAWDAPEAVALIEAYIRESGSAEATGS